MEDTAVHRSVRPPPLLGNENSKRLGDARLRRKQLLQTRQAGSASNRRSDPYIFTERMASIGTLSEGLGHEMGNLLLPIRVRLESLGNADLPLNLKRDVEVIKTSVEYLQRLARGLRILSADPVHADQKEPTEVLSWWRDVGPMIKNALGRGITLECKLPLTESWVDINRPALTQIFLNLIQNADDSIPLDSRGVITIWVEEEVDRISFSVTDNGVGMTDDIQRRCMEPFFTTKSRGVATGLGLSLVFNLVNDAGGTIDVDSAYGEGTTFTVSLARAVKPWSGTNKSTPPLAVVHIADRRLCAFSTTELHALGFEVDTGTARLHQADLLIVDHLPSKGILKPNAHVVLLGIPPERAAPHNAIGLEYSPTPKQLRNAIRSISTLDPVHSFFAL